MAFSEIRDQLNQGEVKVVEIPLFTRFYICDRWLALGFLKHQQYDMTGYVER